MSVPEDSKIKHHEVNYVVRDGKYFKGAVIVLLLIIVLALLCVSRKI
jgi:hypothetical protein